MGRRFVLAIWFRSMNLPGVPGKSYLFEPARIDSAHQWGGGPLKEEKGIKTTNMVRLVQIVILGSVAWYLTGRKIENYRVRIFSFIIMLLWGGHSRAVYIVGPKSRCKWILEGNRVRYRKHSYQPVFSKQAPAPALYYLITFKQTQIVEENKTDVTEKPDYFNILYYFSYLLRS